MAEVVFEDKYVCILNKTNTEDSEVLASERGLFPVHRLDKTTFGLLLTAKSGRVCGMLSADKCFNKTYYTIADGIIQEDKAKLCDLLFHDSGKNKSFVTNKMRSGVKEAIMDYSVIARGQSSTFLEVVLTTGRTHQIRVQLASRHHPVSGDGRYGSKTKTPLALCCGKLELVHPITKEKLCFVRMPKPIDAWAEFKNKIDAIN